MEKYLIKTAQELSKLDCYYDVTRVNKIANTLAKKITAPPPPKVIKRKGQTFSQLLTSSWKMSKNDMQDFDKVKGMFTDIFDTYHDWSINAQKSKDKTYYERGMKVFDGAIDKLMKKMVVSDEKGGPGWNINNLYKFLYQSVPESKYWKTKSTI